jgi:hypothetical protein
MLSFAPLLLALAPSLQDQDAAHLIPADAIVLLRLGSLQGLADIVTTVSTAAGEATGLDPAQILAGLQLPLDPSTLDLSKPIWMAVAIDPAAPVPALTWVAAVKDAVAAKRLESDLAGGPMAPVFQGDFVGFSMRAGYAVSETPSPLVAAMAPGLVSLHVDLAALVQAFGPIIDMGMKQARMEMEALPMDQSGFDLAPMMEEYLDAIEALLDSAQSLDFALERRGERLAFSGSLLARAGSAMDGWESDARVDLATLAGHLDPLDSIQMLGAWDWAAMQRRLGSFVEAALDAYPEEMARQMTVLWDEQVAMADQFLPGVASSFHLDAQGVRGVYVLRAKDPALVIERLGAIMEGFTGPESMVSFERGEPLASGERHATLWRVNVSWDAFDELGEGEGQQARRFMEEFYGKELCLAMATNGPDQVVTYMGPEARVRAAFERGSGDSPTRPGLTRLLERAGSGAPSFVYLFDFGRLLGSVNQAIGAFAPGEAAVLPDLPLEFGNWFSIRGALWSAGVEADLGQIVRYVQAATQLEAADEDR